MDVGKTFSTKQQFLHRIQEGVSFGDGEEYNPASYQRYASKFTKEYKNRHYPEHDLIQSTGGAAGQGGSGAPKENTELEAASTDTNDAANGSSLPKEDRRRFTPENLEQDYWSVVENRSREVVVEYGNDVDTHEFGSGFPLSERGRCLGVPVDPEKVKLPDPKFGTEDYYKETWWNLNNIPNTPDSVLRHVKVGINGINVPWMYYGSLFTTFCWHNEDNYLYSINYHHKGAPKQWYGVPGTKKDADGLEKVFKSYLSMKMRDVPDLLHHITTQFSPRLLQSARVPIYKLLQHEGEYIVTFPRAFHGGFSYGPNIGEAVNFATYDWIAHGSDANERYRSFARPAVFSHDRLTFTMAHHVSEQKSYKNCKLLLDSVERVVAEELLSRKKLIASGVRDVSHLIQLPPNTLDQLDEDSADYDDKRLCHACKHICFFSAVACECSQSKVSCLRHSHYMCRCPIERRYLMVWSPEEELNQICQKVRDHCEKLRPVGTPTEDKGPATSCLSRKASSSSTAKRFPPVAPGVERDLEAHKDDEIMVEPYRPRLKVISFIPTSAKAQPQPVTSDEDRDETIVDEGGMDKDDEEYKPEGTPEDDALDVVDKDVDDMEVIAGVGRSKSY